MYPGTISKEQNAGHQAILWVWNLCVPYYSEYHGVEQPPKNNIWKAI